MLVAVCRRRSFDPTRGNTHTTRAPRLPCSPSLDPNPPFQISKHLKQPHPPPPPSPQDANPAKRSRLYVIFQDSIVASFPHLFITTFPPRINQLGVGARGRRAAAWAGSHEPRPGPCWRQGRGIRGEIANPHCRLAPSLAAPQIKAMLEETKRKIAERQKQQLAAVGVGRQGCGAAGLS